MRAEWRELEKRRRDSEDRGLRFVVLAVTIAAAFLLGAHLFDRPKAPMAPESASEVPEFAPAAASEPTDTTSDSMPFVPQRSTPGRQTYVGIYECVDKGQRVVSDQPCGDDAKARTLVVDRPVPAAVAQPRQQMQTAGRSAPQSTSTTAAGDTYCLYVRSRVTGDRKAHTCRWFNSYQQCREAADRIGAWCGAPN
jgi:Domain of unknown function (DUF4124)